MKKAYVTFAIALIAVGGIGYLLFERANLPNQPAHRKALELPIAASTELVDSSDDKSPSPSNELINQSSTESVEAMKVPNQIAPYFQETVGLSSYLAGELSLSMDQTEQLSQIYQVAMQEKAEIEERLINLEHKTASTAVYTIPAYPEEGAVLRDSFYAVARERLGKDIADAIFNGYSQYIDSSFNQFGHADQVISVTTSKLENGLKIYSLEIETYASKDAAPLESAQNWISSSLVKQYREADLANSPWSFLATQLRSLSPSPQS